MANNKGKTHLSKENSKPGGGGKRKGYLLLWLIAIFIFTYFIWYITQDLLLTVFTTIFCSAIKVLTIERHNSLRKNYPEVFNLIITLVTTLFGVYIALYITNIENEKDKKVKVISILKASKAEIYHAKIDLLKTLDGYPALFTRYIDSTQKFIDEMKKRRDDNNPLFSKPYFMVSLATNDLVQQKVHPRILNKIINAETFLTSGYRGLNFVEYKSLGAFRINIKGVGGFLDYIMAFLQLQIDYHENNIDEDNFVLGLDEVEKIQYNNSQLSFTTPTGLKVYHGK